MVNRYEYFIQSSVADAIVSTALISEFQGFILADWPIDRGMVSVQMFIPSRAPRFMKARYVSASETSSSSSVPSPVPLHVHLCELTGIQRAFSTLLGPHVQDPFIEISSLSIFVPGRAVLRGERTVFGISAHPKRPLDILILWIYMCIPTESC
jgi:hypothetical protein